MSKQSKKFTASSEVGIPMKELTQVHPKPKEESTKRKVPRYQMTNGIVGFVSAVKAVNPNAVCIHILYKPKEVKTKDKFENYAIDPIGMLVKTKTLFSESITKNFSRFSMTVYGSGSRRTRRSQLRISQNRI